MENRELKPCPFCGGEAEVGFVSDKVKYVLKKYHNRYIFAGCRKCGIVTPLYNAHNHTDNEYLNEEHTNRAKERAIEAWNRRANDEQSKNL